MHYLPCAEALFLAWVLKGGTRYRAREIGKFEGVIAPAAMLFGVVSFDEARCTST